jgi:type II secretory pathway component PulF
MDVLQQFSGTTSLPSPFAEVLFFVAFLFSLFLSAAFLYPVYFLLTLPMRRNERARLFLDLLELGLKEGRTPEQAIIEAASSRDHELGVRFHLLAAELRTGMRLDRALQEVPRLLPPQTAAMLIAGARLGDISKVLPACRQRLQDGVSNVRGALNYLVLAAFFLTPLSIMVPIVFRIKVMPQFRAVFEGMLEGTQLPAFTRFVFAQNGLFTWIQVWMLLCLWVVTLFYLGGPRLRHWLRPVLGHLTDWLELHLPWRRKRLDRDFSTMLALLLDANAPEPVAVTLAAESSANHFMKERAARINALLGQGVKLPAAVQGTDGSRELQWRLANALQRGNGFLRALSGWHEALDARAFQLEQTAAQLATTGLVLCNGLIIGSIVAAIFLALIKILNSAILW